MTIGLTVGFFRLKKLKARDGVLKAARHNRRVIAAELVDGGHIDARRCHQNIRLVGPDTAEGVADLAKSLMAGAGIGKLRRDAVRAIELLFSLPRDSTIDHVTYFSACTEWAAEKFGGTANILSSDVHLDEAAPHCHVLVLPLINGRMVGSDLVGGPSKLRRLMQSFSESVGARFGLNVPAIMSTGARAEAAEAVLKKLRSMQDPVIHSSVWPVVRSLIDRDPGDYMVALGVLAPTKARKRLRSMAQIFTSPGRGPRVEANLPC